MTTPTEEKKIPVDIGFVIETLKEIRSDLTDIFLEQYKEWKADFIPNVQKWRNGDKEPDWQMYREWINEICFDDGMPPLFGGSES